MNLQTVAQVSMKMGEDNDCGVRSVAIATGATYEKTHATFAANGRRPRQGVYMQQIRTTTTQLGYEMIDVTAEARSKGAKTVRSAERVLGSGSYLVGVSGHILCIKDGIVEDWTAGRQHRVTQVYKVVPANAPAQVEAPAQPRTVPTAPSKPAAPKPAPGSVKHTIHSVANIMWSEAGKPRNLQALLKLRKSIMDKLESEYNVKRTSASTELGQWQKSIA